MSHPSPDARPQALVVAPTRELAQQIERELTWLFAPLRARMAVVTGGTHVGGDFKAFARRPHVVVGTPGRLVDHLRRGSLVLEGTTTVVLDEADEMLDMGFREDLETLLEATPEGRRTHLVSATFPKNVLYLADRVQREPVMVRGTKVGAPNLDIRHIGYTLHERDRFGALTNILLSSLDQRTLVFARTRAGTHALATELTRRGFAASAISGELGQRERNTTLESFRSGATPILVATDVAARGLDIDDVAQVVHFDLPENDDVFTHRSGRTGRAGNKGTSMVLVPPHMRRRVEAVFRRLSLEVVWRSVPTPEDVRAKADAQLATELATTENVDAASRRLAERILEGSDDPADVVAALLARMSHRGPCEPAHVADATPTAGPRDRRPSGNGPARDDNYTRFVVNWGAQHGANPKRILAMVCRRGDIRGQHVGAIRIQGHSSQVDVASAQADAFAKAAARPDPRNPRVRIRRWEEAGPARKQRPDKHRNRPSHERASRAS